MNRVFETVLSVLALGGFIWVLTFQLPRARREHDAFAVFCSLLTAILALLAFLFIGIGTQSG